MTEQPPSTPPSPEPPTAQSLPLTLAGVHLLAAAESLAAPVAETSEGPHVSESPGSPGEAADQDRQVAVAGMALVLDQLGITVLKPDGSVGAVLPWAEVSRVSTVGPAMNPDGAPALVVEAVTSSRTHRFLVPSRYEDELRAAVAGVAGMGTESDGTQKRPRGRGRRIALAVLGIVVLAGIALALAVTVGGVRL